MPTTARDHHNLILRRRRSRAAIARYQETPRLSVFRSLRHIYAQIIDDKTGTTLASSSDVALKADKGNKTAIAERVGAEIATLAKSKKIQNVRFDRGAYKYHGRIAALAEAARKNGLTF